MWLSGNSPVRSASAAAAASAPSTPSTRAARSRSAPVMSSTKTSPTQRPAGADRSPWPAESVSGDGPPGPADGATSVVPESAAADGAMSTAPPSPAQTTPAAA